MIQRALLVVQTNLNINLVPSKKPPDIFAGEGGGGGGSGDGQGARAQAKLLLPRILQVLARYVGLFPESLAESRLDLPRDVRAGLAGQ